MKGVYEVVSPFVLFVFNKLKIEKKSFDFLYFAYYKPIINYKIQLGLKKSLSDKSKPKSSN